MEAIIGLIMICGVFYVVWKILCWFAQEVTSGMIFKYFVAPLAVALLTGLIVQPEAAPIGGVATALGFKIFSL